MSVCLESSGSSALPVSQQGVTTTTCSKLNETATTIATVASTASKPPDQQQQQQDQLPPPPIVAKPKNNVFVVNNGGEPSATTFQSTTTSTAMQKPTGPVITVVNAPITVVKNIGGTTTPFTLSNNNSVAINQSTITLVNNASVAATHQHHHPQQQATTPIVATNTLTFPVAAPVSMQQPAEKHAGIQNVFIKKSITAEGITNSDMPQSHKLLTANSFPTTNVLNNINNGPILKSSNGQRPGNKVKILSHVVMQPDCNATNTVPGPSNMIITKNQKFYHQKIVGNGATTKYLNKSPDKRLIFPLHNNKQAGAAAKTLPSPFKTQLPAEIAQMKSPGAVQRTGAGIRTIPPQRPMMHGHNKANYIGKHAVQAQKMKPKVKTKMMGGPMMNNHNRMNMNHDPSILSTFNQGLTAQIIEALSDRDSSSSSMSMKPKEVEETREFKPIDALSFVAHAVLLDHNYNATLPSEPPPKPPVTILQTSPLNGAQQFAPVPNYPSNLVKRNRTTSQSALLQKEREQQLQQIQQLREREVADDDAASDISLEAKVDTEGEETDTAPEAEAVTNDTSDRYGDYVTRCICGFIHDDGYMIECDKCKVWQHVRCVVRSKKVPEDYSCEQCAPRPVDRPKARALQQQWMREIQERETKIRKEQLALTDSDSSDAEQPQQTLKNRRKEPPRRQRRDSQNNKCATTKTTAKRKERKVGGANKRATNAANKAAAAAAKQAGKSDDEKLPQLRQWIENYEEAVTNHYSPELRARISSIRLNGAHSELSGDVDPSVNKCKVQAVPSGMKCLVAAVSLPMGTPIIELRGKYMLSTQHRSTTRQQRPGPFLFFHTLVKDTEVCVDTRTYGNSARFIRRSCTPNAKLQHILEKGAVHLYVVTTKSVDKGSELTIRHESHDVAASSLTDIPCACINPEYCALLKNHRRHNGDVQVPVDGRKRRGRQSRENAAQAVVQPVVPVAPPNKEEPESDEREVKVKEEPVEIKKEAEEEETVKVKPDSVTDEIKKEEPEDTKQEVVKEEAETEAEPEIKIEQPKVEEVAKEETRSRTTSPHPPPVTTRRTSRHAHDSSTESVTTTTEPEKKPMSREERKMQAIVKAIERMEKQEQRRQEHQAKQTHRRESDSYTYKEDGLKTKRRKRKGRARTVSTNSSRRNRLDSAESMHSSDDTLLSPPSVSPSPSKAADLLLSLANGETARKSSPVDRTLDSNSNSAHSSPETPLSSACLLVAAAVEPLAGFKFPKTKKVLMNEWLNKTDVVVQPASAISPSSLTPHLDVTKDYNSTTAQSKSLGALAQAAASTLCGGDQQHSGSAKKRWLRQAISEDKCDDSPPPQGATDTVAPPKKRRLPRESSCESSPPTTPTLTMPILMTTTTTVPPLAQVEIVTHQDEDGTTQMESDATLSELASEMRQEYGSCVQLPQREEETSAPPSPPPPPPPPPAPPAPVMPELVAAPLLAPVVEPVVPVMRAIMDPRLAPRLSNNDLIGTVEKTLSFLGFDESKTKKPQAITPTKRKLSITEYRQRKKLNNNDKSVSGEDVSINEESSSSQSPKSLLRTRSNSASSVTSTSTSDEENINNSIVNTITATTTPEVKGLSGFNSEPTELERQRENATLRLKKALGISVDDSKKPPTLNVENILNVQLITPIKSALTSPPSFPIPGSTESVLVQSSNTEEAPHESAESSEESSSAAPATTSDDKTESSEMTNAESSEEKKEHFNGLKENCADSENPVLFYTPDDEEVAESTSSYVPPFNNPLYPNTNYTSFGSVIDDDAPYEGRNPSPPPDLDSAA